MAVTAKKKRSKQRKWNLSETQRWVLGVILFIFAVFLLVSVVSYYFYWPEDQNFVQWGGMLDEPDVVMNPTGKTGAVLADYIVGEWFGVFGLVIPLVLIILALRIINYKPSVLRKSVRISLVVMILGSLTLGFAFGTKWSVFGTGLGGAHGIVVSDWMRSFLGGVGTGLVLLLGWILLGVYVNSRRTMSVVNKVGKGIYEGGVKVGGVLGHAAGAISGADDAIDETDAGAAETPDMGTPVKAGAETKPEPVQPEPVMQGRGRTGNKINAGMEITGREIKVVDPVEEQRTVTLGEEPFGNDILEVVRPAGEPEADIFEISGSRGNRESGNVFTVGGGVPEIQETTLAAKNVVELGQDAGEFITGQGSGGRYGDASGVQYAGGVGIYADEDRRNGGARAEGADNDSGVFQVVTSPGQGGADYNPSGGSRISVGGVVEAASPDGVKPGDALEVIVAGRRDAELSGDEIDDSLYDPTRELSKYQKPPVEILEDHSVDVQVTEEEIYENKNQIVRTLENFGIKIDKIKATIGPTVTLYEIVPAAGVKISKIKNLEDDIALSLKALGIRIIAPMPGKGTVGIEVPNKDKEIVSMYSVVKTMKFQESKYELPIVLGKTISNETFMIDLAKMPHLLVAGATGQGKSVGLNAIITSLLYKKHPAELKFVLVDPKRVELSLYSRLEKHFLAKMESEEEAILTDTQKVVYTLNALCQEMSDRYDLLRMAEVKKISEYNEKFLKRRLNPNKGHKFMPYIVVVVDEFADMIMTAGREVETPITRLAQLARAVGIHLVIATQRPDVKVITGLIKANFPARIAFRVMSMVDSRTIIDQPGANQLIGRGDMLMSLNGELTRVQCAFIDTPEIERITEFISNQKGYTSAYELPDYQPDADVSMSKASEMGQLDAMFEDVARFVVQNQQGSTSSIQRRFSIGYNRAGRIMDQLESAGIVGRAEGSKPREVLITDVASLEYILGRLEQ